MNLLPMTIELLEADLGAEIYGLIERGFIENVVHYEGSKVEVLSFYLGMVGPIANA